MEKGGGKSLFKGGRCRTDNLYESDPPLVVKVVRVGVLVKMTMMGAFDKGPVSLVKSPVSKIAPIMAATYCTGYIVLAVLYWLYYIVLAVLDCTGDMHAACTRYLSAHSWRAARQNVPRQRKCSEQACCRVGMLWQARLLRTRS
eukprot:361987-Chlamydomonas_euryale.AAC.2